MPHLEHIIQNVRCDFYYDVHIGARDFVYASFSLGCMSHGPISKGEFAFCLFSCVLSHIHNNMCYVYSSRFFSLSQAIMEPPDIFSSFFAKKKRNMFSFQIDLSISSNYE